MAILGDFKSSFSFEDRGSHLVWTDGQSFEVIYNDFAIRAQDESRPLGPNNAPCEWFYKLGIWANILGEWELMVGVDVHGGGVIDRVPKLITRALAWQGEGSGYFETDTDPADSEDTREFYSLRKRGELFDLTVGGCGRAVKIYGLEKSDLAALKKLAEQVALSAKWEYNKAFMAEEAQLPDTEE